MKSIILSPDALVQIEEWKKNDPKILFKIISLITEIASTPFTGTGKPELLKHQLKGKWSRRITQEHRLVYEVTETTINIISCKFHYG
jgi:toxin YoeB